MPDATPEQKRVRPRALVAEDEPAWVEEQTMDRPVGWIGDREAVQAAARREAAAGSSLARQGKRWATGAKTTSAAATVTRVARAGTSAACSQGPVLTSTRIEDVLELLQQSPWRAERPGWLPADYRTLKEAAWLPTVYRSLGAATSRPVVATATC